MNRPGLATPVFRPRAITLTRVATMALVGALHVVLIYALAIGLAARLVYQLPEELTAEIIKPEHPKEPPPPLDVNLAKPQLPSVPPPLIRIQQESAVAAITTIVAPPKPAPVVVVPPAPPPPTPASAIARTHTIPPYPEQARRLGEQGTVRLQIEVAIDGSVNEVTVVASSGSSILDEAAAAWVKDHWRYRPATQGGHAVSTSVQAAVVFNLKNAG